MGGVDFLNLEYIILRVYEWVTGLDVEVEDLPDWLLFWTGQITLIGMTFAVLFLALVVYVRIRIVFIEQEGFENKGSDIYKPAPEPEAPASKNPRWDRVRVLVESASESEWRRAIIEADVILGSLLSDQGYRGSTIGDQLRDANPLQFTTLDLAWKAHKVRNEIAHGGEGYHLSERDARATVDLYARVFEEFNYI